MTGFGQKLKTAIRRATNAIGYDIVGFDGNNPRARLARLLKRHRISLILDVGANSGQFGHEMRALGYAGRIVSFEPLPDAFLRLGRAAAGDSKWQTINLGLGDDDEQRMIHVAANSQSSSLLPMLSAHLEAAPESRFIKDAPVIIRRLDHTGYSRPDDAIFLKIDTQGFEMQVLEGARGVMGTVKLLQLECSLVPLYDGAELIENMIGHVRALGYVPAGIAPTFHHRENGHLMQADLLFAQV